MKYCASCKTEYADSAKFCAGCGGMLSEMAQAEFVREESENAPAENIAFRNGNAQPNAAAAINRKIENHLVKSIIATVCCCLPFGVVAIIFAAQVDTKVRAGDLKGALEASDKANLWSNLSIGMGVLQVIMWVAIYATIGLAAFKEL